MTIINITKDKQTQKQLNLLDDKMDKLIEQKIKIDKKISNLIEERKSVLRQFFRKCEEDTILEESEPK